MLNLFQILENQSVDFDLLDNDRLYYDFGNFLVILDLDVSYNGIEFFKKSKTDLKKDGFSSIFPDFVNDIKEMALISFENLSDKSHRSTSSILISTSFKLYDFLKLIYSLDPNLLVDYNIGLDRNLEIHPLLKLSGNADYYFFRIKINIKNPNIKSMLSMLMNRSNMSINIPNNYLSFIDKATRFESSKSLGIISTNTKVRRLGYLKLISDLFENYSKIPTQKIDNRFEEYAELAKNDLLRYPNSKGLIKKTKTGISAKPYIGFFTNIDWLTKLNRVYIAGKAMKVYQILKKQDVKDKDENSFYLSTFDKSFFLEKILINDYFYISSLIELLYINSNNCSYQYLIETFQGSLVKKLNDILGSDRVIASSKELREIRAVRDRINGWEKPEKYLEHLIMPRLNWLFDLGLINFYKHQRSSQETLYQLNDKGKSLFKHFCFWTDLNQGYILNPVPFIKTSYMQIFHYVYGEVDLAKTSDRLQINEKIDKYIIESLNLFKTLAPNRVTSSQAFLYIKNKIYFSDGLVIEEKSIEDYLIRGAREKFVYKFQEQYGDGYIQNIKK